MDCCNSGGGGGDTPRSFGSQLKRMPFFQAHYGSDSNEIRTFEDATTFAGWRFRIAIPTLLALHRRLLSMLFKHPSIVKILIAVKRLNATLSADANPYNRTNFPQFVSDFQEILRDLRDDIYFLQSYYIDKIIEKETVQSNVISLITYIATCNNINKSDISLQCDGIVNSAKRGGGREQFVHFIEACLLSISEIIRTRNIIEPKMSGDQERLLNEVLGQIQTKLSKSTPRYTSKRTFDDAMDDDDGNDEDSDSDLDRRMKTLKTEGSEYAQKLRGYQ